VPSLTTIALADDIKADLARLPTTAGVGQILDRQGRNLLIGRPAHLRNWAAANLGFPRKVVKGRRPPTDLRPIAGGVAFAEATSAFHHRLLYERLMAVHVPRARRKDLKPPGFLRLDLQERFPRLVTVGEGDDLSTAFGPFRDRKAAEKAREALHKHLRLRPCDYTFEPDPQLPLGVSCLFAQVRSCAAPCLKRVSEAEYRDLSRQAAEALAAAEARGPELSAVIPPFVSAAGSRGLVAASNREGVELYPVRGGRVYEEHQAIVPRAADETLPPVADLAAALASLGSFEPGTPPEGDDRPWLLSWLQAPRRGGDYLVWPRDEPLPDLAARVRQVLS
jgi:hypothetical protein